MQLQEKIDVRARKKTLKMLLNKNLVFQQKYGFATKKTLHCNFVEHLQYGNYDVEKYIIQETVNVGKAGESVYQHISNDQKAPRRM